MSRRSSDRTLSSKDACIILDADDTERRYYLRVLIPFRVVGLSTPCSWGVWVEVSGENYDRAQELWDDPNQSSEPPFQGSLANTLQGYSQSFGMVGLVSLRDPSNIPLFHLTSPSQHLLVREQANGVSPERVMEWLVPVYYPEALAEGTG